METGVEAAIAPGSVLMWDSAVRGRPHVDKMKREKGVRVAAEGMDRNAAAGNGWLWRHGHVAHL